MNLTQCIRGGSRDGRNGYLLGFPYEEEAVETLKRSIPHTAREWREAEEIWWVSIEFDEVLRTIFPNFYALAHLQGRLF